MFCPNCGTQNDDDGVKCQKCGFNLKGAAAPKFKGTMLMMNSPMAAAPRPAPAPGVVPGPAQWPKSMGKATMIGVAPPSPGGIAPPIAPKSPATQALSGAPLPATPPPTGSTAPVARPGAGPAAAGVAPVNPFGGTMLMGATPLAAPHEASPPQAAFPQQPAEKPAPDRTVTSEGAPPPAAAVAGKLETTTPSVSPPAQLAPQVSTQNEMPAMGSADTAPAPADPSDLANAPAFPKQDWGAEALGAGAPLASVGAGIVTSAKAQTNPQVRPIGKVVGLGILTFGIYWLIALWGAFNDFKLIRQKNDIVPIYFFVPVLGWLELIKLPGKVMETRTATAVPNPAVPNVVLYLLFPQIFFIADLNEIVAAVANRRTLT